MFFSLLLFVCVALNCWLIWSCLSRPLRAGMIGLGSGLARTRLYFSRPLTEVREKALRQRTSRLLRQSAVVILVLGGILVLYGPAMLFAHYRSGIGAAFYSLEAMTGMRAAAVLVVWRGR